jgi:predicted dienelactone hydrolase
MRKLVLVLAAVLSGVGPAGAETRPAAAKPNGLTVHVGVTTRVFHPAEQRNWRGDAQKSLRCTVWYPAAGTAVETRQVVGPPDAPLFEAGMASPGAAFAPSVYAWPLVLLSHGTGGSALQMAWLGTALARAGFVAVAVDHPGNNANEALTPEGFALWWERATDLSEVLDGMLADTEFGPVIDPKRVAAAGYSLGGYTVLELAGAQTDIARLFDLCAKDADTAVCHVPEMHGLGPADEILKAVRKTSGESLARSGESFRDPRIKAVFAIAPALGFTLTEESLRGIKRPVEMVVGDADRIAPAETNAEYVHAYVRNSGLTVLPKVTHYTFLDSCTAAGKRELPRYCEEDADRDAVHAKVAAMAVEFFAKALR